MRESSEHIAHEALDADLQAYRAGQDAAADRLVEAVRPAVALDVTRFLGRDDPEAEDVVQEALMAALGYVRRREGFQGNFVRLAVTIARNRCRDLYRYRQIRPQAEVESLADWLACPGRSALDDLEEKQLLGLLQEGLDSLGETCNWLLRELYLNRRTLDSVRERLGIGTAQGVLYRRETCLEKLRSFLKSRLGPRSGSDPRLLSGPPRRPEDETR